MFLCSLAQALDSYGDRGMSEQPGAPICERCNMAEAVIHITRVVQNVRTLHHYCVPCAQALGAVVNVASVDRPASPDDLRIP